MTDYTKLVKELRGCKDVDYCRDCPRMANGYVEFCNIKDDAAAAIEALQAEAQFYKALADEWQASAENKERLLGLYRAEQAKHFYSAIDDNGRIIANPCACMNIPVFPDSSESPNS